jgi:hypothetical protein
MLNITEERDNKNFGFIQLLHVTVQRIEIEIVYLEKKNEYK